MSDGRLLSPDALRKAAEAAEAAEAAMPSPFAGFWPRLGAAVCDFFVLHMTLRLFDSVCQPLFYSMGRGGYFFGMGLVLLYFALCEGPLGKGRTLGKMLMGLRVVGRDFQTLSHGAAFLRSLRYSFLLAFYFGSLLYVVPGQAIGLDAVILQSLERQSLALLIAAALVHILLMSGLLANCLMLMIHPVKCGIHDALLGTYVVRKDQVEGAAAALEERLAQRDPRPLYRYLALGYIVLGSIILFRLLNGPDWTRMERRAQHRRDVAERFAIPGAHTAFSCFDTFDYPSARDHVLKYRQALKPDGGGEMSPAERKALLRGPARAQGYQAVYYHYGALDLDDRDTSRTILSRRAEIRQYCLDLYHRREYPFDDFLGVGDDLPTSAVFGFVVVDYYNLGLLTHGQLDYLSTASLTLNGVEPSADWDYERNRK